MSVSVSSLDRQFPLHGPMEARLHRFISMMVFMLGISIFFFNEPTRTMLSNNSINQNLNVPYIIIAGGLMFVVLHRHLYSSHLLILSSLFAGIVFIDLYNGHRNYVQYIVVISNIIIPMLLSDLEFDQDRFKKLYLRFLSLYNKVIYFLIFVGLLDYVSKASIQLYLADHFFNPEWAHLVHMEHNLGIYRYYSFIGHPLASSWYILMFYIINYLGAKYYRIQVNKFVLAAVTLIGLVLCGSKSAMIIGFLMVLMFTGVKKYKALYYIAFAAASTGLFFSPMFQKNLLQRYVIGLKSGDMGEGRSRALEYVLKGWIDSPELFSGGGPGYSREVIKQVGTFIGNFEYPLVMFLYDLSIVGTFLVYAVILISPLHCFLKRKQIAISVVYLLAFIYLNSFNAIANYTDYLGQLGFLILLLKNISRVPSTPDVPTKIYDMRGVTNER